MLAQYLASLGATNWWKSKIESPMAVHSPQVTKHKTRKGPFMSICQWKASASFSKDIFYERASVSALFLIFVFYLPIYLIHDNHLQDDTMESKK